MANKQTTLNILGSAVTVGIQNNYAEIAHSGVLANYTGSWQQETTNTLRFSTFYHPHVARLIERLNIGGVDLLMKADTSLMIDDYRPFVNSPGSIPTDDKGSTFKGYQPGSTPAPDSESLVEAPIPLENFDFDDRGAFSKYNWELFYHVPLYIATRLSNNGKYPEAMQWFNYIFNPASTLPADPSNPNGKFWEFFPFQTTTVQILEDIVKSLTSNSDPALSAWLTNPFDPFAIARARIAPFMKDVIMRYLDNLIAWGDDLYRANTIESINEATQLYVIAAHILGPQPQKVPDRVNRKVATYNSLKDNLNAFSEAQVSLENLFPYSGNISSPGSPNSEPSGSLLGIGSVSYFCIPDNDDLLQYWTTVGDRLFNIRHCKNFEGIDQVLALFAPPIDPGLLVRATAQGLSIGSILADLNTPFPLYRFNFLLQKANEFCNEVKGLGSALLAALEKEDAEDLARLRASQESALLDLITGVKERQVLEAKVGRENILKSRETAQKRMQYYLDLLGISDMQIPSFPQIADNLTADSSLPSDTLINEIKPQVDTSLADNFLRGVTLIPRETQELVDLNQASQYQQSAGDLDYMASIFSFIPFPSLSISPMGVGISIPFPNIGAAITSEANQDRSNANEQSFLASNSAKLASYTRREQEWGQQANMAAREIIQLDKQITAADIRIQIAQRELTNHQTQHANAQAIEDKLINKFTNTELYIWMQEQLYGTFKQVYQLAYDMSKKAETAYRFELGKTDSNFIQYGYWDSSYQGLSAGDKLQLALRQMEKSFFEENEREFELTKHISLTQLNPLALIQLKETGTCFLNVPEELFDLDYSGHYFRRIKSVSITIPCISGPYTTINSTLRLTQNSIRINSINTPYYEHKNDNGLLSDDDRFIENNIPFNAIATSSAQNDSGVFELNFRDERYLPFEGAGVVSSWKLELNGKYPDPKDGSKILNLAQFDYDSISDVIIHIKYTAREDAGQFKQSAILHLENYINPAAGSGSDPFMRLFSIRHEFANEWFNFLSQKDQSQNQVLSINLDSKRYPLFTMNKNIIISNVMLFARSSEPNLTSKGIGLLTGSDIPVPPVNPGLAGKNKNGNVQPMAGIISNDLPQTTFDYSGNVINTGLFIIINPKSSGFDLTKDTIKDLIMVVSYQLSIKQ